MLSTKSTILDTFKKKGAKKRSINKEEWARNTRKRQRLSGEGYVSSTGVNVQGKKFSIVDKCCNKICFTKISTKDQQILFDKFWTCEAKSNQDALLASYMSIAVNTGRKRPTVNPKVDRSNCWKYAIKLEGNCIDVCRAFIIALLQVSIKRIRCVLAKIVTGQSFEEKRGCHANRPNKLAANVWELAIKHLKSIPHRNSHYCQCKTNRVYFENPEITIKGLYNSFCAFFSEETGSPLKMAYKTYFKFYRGTNFTVQQPKTDVCDFCTDCKKKLEVNPRDECILQYNVHKKRAEKYLNLKRDIIKRSKEDDSLLVLEFDYGQNLPLPKLNVTKQFYSRLIWLFIFNIHVHNDDTSFIYSFIESQAKKGSNSVASFIFDCLIKVLDKYPNIKEIVLLSDAAGGQNKNMTMLQCCSWLAKTHNVVITQMFPVRGHSFGQCDRNFGLIKSFIKKKAVIEAPEVYYEAIRNCRKNPSPFQLIDGKEIVYDWKTAFEKFFFKKPAAKNDKFGIQKYVIIKCQSSGVLACSTTYSEVLRPFRFMRTYPDEFTLDQAPREQLNPNKVADVKSLLCFISEENRKFYTDLFVEEINTGN